LREVSLPYFFIDGYLSREGSRLTVDKLEVVTFGETMVLFTPTRTGPLRYSYSFERQTGGAESNFAIGIAKLGHRAGWISRLGDDEFGAYILSFIRGEGVDVSAVVIDEEYPTGVFFKERREAGEPRVFYYRKGSAAGHMTPEDIDERYLAQAKYLHVTGITPALSESCYETTLYAMNLAKKHGLAVTLDPNIRLKLWSGKQAAKVIKEMIPLADYVLPGIAEGEIIFGTSDPVSIGRQILEMGPKAAVVKLGKKGSYVVDSSTSELIPGFEVERVIDPIGAGDAFAAGFVTGLLDDLDICEAATRANAAGAFATTVVGDVEGTPNLNELNRFMAGGEVITR
jgi:2-dehydro-3-deoxygluconokinase